MNSFADAIFFNGTMWASKSPPYGWIRPSGAEELSQEWNWMEDPAGVWPSELFDSRSLVDLKQYWDTFADFGVEISSDKLWDAIPDGARWAVFVVAVYLSLLAVGLYLEHPEAAALILDVKEIVSTARDLALLSLALYFYLQRRRPPQR